VVLLPQWHDPTRVLPRARHDAAHDLSIEGIAAAFELQNDGFNDGDRASFHSRFVVGELDTARVVPAVPGQLPLDNALS
jgi:hypothetical protein